RGGFYSFQHVYNPLLPSLRFSYCVQLFIVLIFMLNNILRYIEDRFSQQLFGNQHQHIQNSPGSAVTVIKWMYRFELIMCNSHLHRRVEVIVTIYEAVTILELVLKQSRTCRRGINPLTSKRSTNVCALTLAEACNGTANLRTTAFGHNGCD